MKAKHLKMSKDFSQNSYNALPPPEKSEQPEGGAITDNRNLSSTEQAADLEVINKEGD